MSFVTGSPSPGSGLPAARADGIGRVRWAYWRSDVGPRGANAALERRIIRKVELSSDGGSSWQPAEITAPSERYGWRQWHVTWDPPGPGHYSLAVRAQDQEGDVQPEEARWNRLGYVVNGLKPVCVSVV